MKSEIAATGHFLLFIIEVTTKTTGVIRYSNIVTFLSKHNERKTTNFNASIYSVL